VTSAEREHLIRAAARNHSSWMIAQTLAGGGAVERHGALRWLGGPGGHATLAFPRYAPRPALDALLDWSRRRGAGGIGCWVSGLEPTGELAARLVARGFEWGWQPHWMALDLDRLPLEETDERVVLVTEVPEYGDGFGQTLMALVRRNPHRFAHAVARIDGAYAGHATVHVIGGRFAGAGIYDVDVLPGVRRRGLGRALTLAVCRAAARVGAQVATLNATGEGELLYRALGFRSLGLGQTWWIHRSGLRAPPPPELVSVAEAAGRGDVAALERLAPPVGLLRRRLPGNGLSLAEVARDAGHPRAAAWLEAQG
jgi:GNAT superfamily N-acetyltransferase